MAGLYFTYSAMNAGKSTLLLQAAHNYREQGMQVMLWTSSHHGDRAGAETGLISSRIGLSDTAHLFYPTTSFRRVIEMFDTAELPAAIFIDEAQFLSQAQVRQLAELCDQYGVPVLCYGLRTDFRGILFDGAAELLAIADHLREARTICHCGRKATMNLRTDGYGRTMSDGVQVKISKEAYTSLCRKHWREAVESQEA